MTVTITTRAGYELRFIDEGSALAEAELIAEHDEGLHADAVCVECAACLHEHVTEEYCFLCGRATDHRGEH